MAKPKPKPWVLTLDGVFAGRFAKLTQARRAVEKPYRHGFAKVRREGPPAAEWIRRGGSWFDNGAPNGGDAG
jgi:hypothetical protein